MLHVISVLDLKSVAGPPTQEINHTSYIGAISDVGAFKEGYLCKHEEFYRETTCYRLSTQPEHTANWFHTKRCNDLGFIPFTSQATYTASELNKEILEDSRSLGELLVDEINRKFTAKNGENLPLGFIANLLQKCSHLLQIVVLTRIRYGPARYWAILFVFWFLVFGIWASRSHGHAST
ncbi:hypothetical protein DY000_02019443 [Brassica cretica]|uniref:Uncharacterized protein n=1 Tax=Brassica cretica TaxID=69181 RepID=A0ABQ7D1I6_BRACR|nr:hypothetical protein DY000_02019443 [Brassica cretica]